MKVTVLFVFVIFCFVVDANRISKGISVERESILSNGWNIEGRSSSDMELPFSIAMKQSNLPLLYQKLNDVSNPKSENYGRYLSNIEIEDLVRTSEVHRIAILSWLKLENINVDSCSVINGDVLSCSATVGQLERLLNTELYDISHLSKDVISVTHFNQLSIPFHLDEAIDLIQGLSFIPKRKAIFHHGEDPFAGEISNAFENFISKTTLIQKSIEFNDSPKSILPLKPIWNSATQTSTCPTDAPLGCSTANGVSSEFCCGENSVCCPSLDGGSCCLGGYKCCYGECKAATDCTPTVDIPVQPQTLRDHYSVPSNIRATTNYFNQSVVAFTDEYSQGALDFFVDVLNEVSVGVTREGPAGCLPNCDQVESDLDMQYMSALGSGVGLWFWYNAQGYTLEWAQSVLAANEPPIVYSISYISGEYQLGDDYISRSNAEFVKMGTMGITVMACSGDTGAPGWSINFPVDSSARNFPFDCPDCPLSVNYCNQITVETPNAMCNVPSGMYSRDLKRGLPCMEIMKNTDCQQAYSSFVNSAQSCGFSIVQDSQDVPRVFSLNCTCSELPTITSGNCTISGFSFSESNGEPLTSLYPASSPFVTAVGATQFSELTNYICNQEFDGSPIQCDIGEVASSIATGSRITSGGGFSTLSLAEPYQASAVSNYLNSGVPLPTGFYNSSLRGYPDVAFGGHNWLITYSKDSSETCPCQFGAVDGTSCASPGFSGLVSLLNQELFKANLPVLGFLNPLLYTMAEEAPETFQDITSGDNYCTEYVCSEKMGYRAAVGWDGVTGLGTPHFTNILNYLIE